MAIHPFSAGLLDVGRQAFPNAVSYQRDRPVRNTNCEQIGKRRGSLS